MTPIRQQRGATLMVTLIMLVILTLFALTAFNLSSVNLRIVGNFQQQRLAESLVQQALEQVMSTVSLFTTPAALCLPSGAAPTGTPLTCALASDVLIDRPRCNYTAPAKGYTKKIGELTPEDTNWEVRASYTDSLTKASVVIVQGVGVRMLAGNCPTS
ncbi:MAG TPA: PilX N-terminal domain-containing pilus assembly protein [Gemmatimonadales bacterium]|nr:PilX N-terminal domain-containing pilus assembly protein [Gemmatimonadales bacterium]